MRVINKYKASKEELAKAVYIGRPSALENPFKLSSEMSRDKSVKRFRSYFINEIAQRNQAIISALESLNEEDLLLCHCAPLACHGDTVKEIWEFLNRSGGVAVSLDLFDWVYRDEIKKGIKMSTELNYLLTLEPAGYSALNNEDDSIIPYRVNLSRLIMTRDAAVENAFRHVVNNPDELNTTAMTPYESAKLSTLKNFVVEFRLYNSDYEAAYHRFKENHNHERIDYDPKDDGVTHINIYSKGKTELGRLLSNFGHTPFKHPDYGFFSSIEAFWYWLSLGKSNDNLRSLYGYQAKKEGAALRVALEKQGNKPPHIDNFKAEIKKAILCKIEQNERLSSLLKNSTLPLTHYYVWGDEKDYRITYPEKYAWIHEYIADVRDYLNGKAHKVIIAGSRDLNKDDLIRKILAEQNLKIVEFVSGTAKGPDTTCIKIAKEMEIPCKLMPADWDTHKKSAGFIRNNEMAQYGTYALLFWDGSSHGTKQMAERCKYYGIPHHVFRIDK